MFELTNINYDYPGTPGLRNVSLSVAAGDYLAVMGPNGSGKSTLFKIIMGLLEPSNGTYQYDGQPVTVKRAQRLHQEVGFVFQNSDVQLFNDTVRSELAFGPEQQGLATAAVTQRVDDVLQLLGIEALAERVPYQLSGGEKKLVALGSVLTMNPRAIVLDEPFNGLAMRYQNQLLDLLAQLNVAGKTIIMSSHNYVQVADRVRRVVVLGADHTVQADAAAADLTAAVKDQLRQL